MPDFDLPKILSKDQYDALPVGSDYADPEGNTRTKSWKVSNASEYETVPEGADFYDPQGNKRTKLRSENIDTSAQTLYNLAPDDATRRNILKKYYPDADIREDPRGLYAVQNDKRYRASATEMAPMLRFAAEAAAFQPEGIGFLFPPTALPEPPPLEKRKLPSLTEIATRVAADIPGTTLDIAAPVGGAIAGLRVGGPVGSIAGAAAGGAAERGIKDAILRASGVLPETTTGQELARVGEEALVTGAGQALGMGAVGAANLLRNPPTLSAFTDSVKNLGSRLTEPAKAAGRYFTGFTPEVEQTVADIQGQGFRVPPSLGMPKAPYVSFMNRVFGAITGENPVEEAAAQVVKQRARQELAAQGLSATEVESTLTPALRTPVDYAPAGQALHEDYTKQVSSTLNRIRAETEAALKAQETNSIEQTAASHAAWADKLQTAKESFSSAQQAVQNYVQSGFKMLGNQLERVRAKYPEGARPGQLYADAGKAIKNQYAEQQEIMKGFYDDAYSLAGDSPIGIHLARKEFDDMLLSLPPEVRNMAPAALSKLRMPDVMNETGSAFLTLPELHSLRSWLRYPANWDLISSDVRNGVMKRMAGLIDRSMRQDYLPINVKAAVETLDTADGLYREIIVPFKHSKVQAIANALSEGLAPDPQKLAEALMQPHQTELREFLKKTVGPAIYEQATAARVAQMLKSSETATPGTYDAGVFLREFLEAQRNGLADEFPSSVRETMRRQAQVIEALSSKGEGLPFTGVAGDDLKTLMARAAAAAAEVKAATKANPIKALGDALRGIKEQQSAQTKAAYGALRPVLNKSADEMKFAEAAQTIWRDKDLLPKALAQFGADSEGIILLRQAAIKDFYSVDNIANLPKAWASLNSTQRILLSQGATPEESTKFFAVLQDVMQESAKSDWGTGLAGVSALTHPLNAPMIGPVLKTIGRRVPGLGSLLAIGGVGRAIASFVGSRAQNFMTGDVYRYLARASAGTAEEQDLVKQVLRYEFGAGGPIGAYVAEQLDRQVNP